MKKPQFPKYGILIENHSHDPGFSTTLHHHTYHSLIYVVSGKGSCIIAGKKHKIETNCIILLKKRQMHQFCDSPGNPMTVFVVYFNDNVALHISDLLTPLLSLLHPIYPSPFQVRDIRAALRQMLYEQDSKPRHFEISIIQCFAAIILKLSRTNLDRSDENQNSMTRVGKVLDYFERHYYEPIKLPEAVKMANLSLRQFRTIVRKIKQRNFVQFINFVRIQKASHLLHTTSMSVTAIAFEVGFEDLSTFYRSFHKLHKDSPAKFRKLPCLQLLKSTARRS